MARNLEKGIWILARDTYMRRCGESQDVLHDSQSIRVYLDLKLREYLYLFVLGGLRSQNKRLSFVLGGLDFYSELEFLQLENSHWAIGYV